MELTGTWKAFPASEHGSEWYGYFGVDGRLLARVRQEVGLARAYLTDSGQSEGFLEIAQAKAWVENH